MAAVSANPAASVVGVITLPGRARRRAFRAVVDGARVGASAGSGRQRNGAPSSMGDGPRLLREAAADVLIWLDGREPSADLEAVLASSTRLGLWTVRQGDGRLVHDGTGMAEVFSGQRLTRVSLVETSPTGDRTTLRAGTYRTIGGSPMRNRDVALEGLASLLAPQLHAPAAVGTRGMGTSGPDGHTWLVRRTDRTRRRVRALPSSVARVALSVVTRHVTRLLRHDDWNIGVALDASYGDVVGGRLPPITWFPRRRGHFAADPFVLRRGDRTHLFFEDYAHATGRGEIAHVELRHGRPDGQATTALTGEHHLSYPFPVEADDRVYLLPEASTSGTAALHAPTVFPTTWVPARTLVRGVPISDGTLVFENGRWWLFATVNGPREDAELFIWHAESLEAPWTAHAGNPVKVDVRSARPGGTPFRWRGDLYRPAQDASVRYGGRLVINRITVLSEAAFAEETVGVLAPDPDGPYPDGCHTLSIVEGLAVVDGYRTTFSSAAFARLSRSALQRLFRRHAT